MKIKHVSKPIRRECDQKGKKELDPFDPIENMTRFCSYIEKCVIIATSIRCFNKCHHLLTISHRKCIYNIRFFQVTIITPTRVQLLTTTRN